MQTKTLAALRVARVQVARLLTRQFYHSALIQQADNYDRKFGGGAKLLFSHFFLVRLGT